MYILHIGYQYLSYYLRLYNLFTVALMNKCIKHNVYKYFNHKLNGDYISFKPWIFNYQIIKLFVKYNLVLHLDHNKLDILVPYPIKNSEYMASALPTLISNHTNKINIFGKASEYFNAEHVKAIAEKLNFLYFNLIRTEMTTFGLNL